MSPNSTKGFINKIIHDKDGGNKDVFKSNKLNEFNASEQENIDNSDSN